MNNDQSTGMSWLAVLFIIIVIAALFGGFGNGFGFGRGNMPYPVNDTGCNRVSNCEVEKQGIIDTSRTQYLIEQQSNDTRMAINASTEAVTVTPAAAGTVTVTLYKDGVAVPGATASATAAANGTVDLSIPALVRQVCCAEGSALTLVLAGAAATVNNVALRVQRI